MGLMQKIFLNCKKFVASLLLVSILAGPAAIVVAPTPAHAQESVEDALNWATDLATEIYKLIEEALSSGLLRQIYDLFTSVSDLFGEWFDRIGDAEMAVTKIQIEGMKIQNKMKSRQTDYLIDQDSSDTRLRALMEHAGDHAQGKTDYLCKATLLHQLAANTKDYRRAVSRIAEKSIESMGRGPRDKWDGPMYFASAERLRCYFRFGSPVDGYPAECIDTETGTGPEGGTAHRLLIDADLSPFTMDGAVTLEMPEWEARNVPISPTETIQVVVANPQNYNQRMWLAALSYCFQMAGPRPSPPWGNAILTERGKRDRATFVRGLAMQSTYNSKCTDLLAYHTRPTTTSLADNPATAQLVEDQNEICRNLQGPSGADGLFSADEIRVLFDNCEKGLSDYQADYINHALCKNPNHFIAQALSGGTQPPMTEETITCQTAWNTWNMTMTAMQGSLVDAAKGQMEVKRVWSEMSSATKSASLDDLSTDPYDFVNVMKGASAKSKAQPVKDSKKAKPVENNIPIMGRPFNIDEHPLPETVAQ